MDLQPFLADALAGVELSPGTGIDASPNWVDAELACGELIEVWRHGRTYHSAEVGPPASALCGAQRVCHAALRPEDALREAIAQRLLDGVNGAVAAAYAAILRNLAATAADSHSEVK